MNDTIARLRDAMNGHDVAAMVALFAANYRSEQPVHPQRGWERLRRLGWTPQVPRPRPVKADPAAQAACKKSSRP